MIHVEIGRDVFEAAEAGRPIYICGRRYILDPCPPPTVSRLIDVEPDCLYCGHPDRWHPMVFDQKDLVCAGQKCVCRKRQP